jgi:fructokinase
MDIVCLGEILIDMFPAEFGRRLADVSAFIPRPGGAPANVAVAARRLGSQVAFIGKVGEDAFGQVLAKTLRDENVDIRSLRFDPSARTTLAFIAKPDAATSEYVFYRNPGADLRLNIHDLDFDLLHSCKVLHIGSLSLVDEPARSATHAAVQIVHSVGGLISFDVNYRPSLWDSPAKALEQIHTMLPRVDLVKVNEEEARLLTGSQDPLTTGKALLEKGPALVVLTLGTQGSHFITRSDSGFVPAFPVEAVDATGCGDAFMGGLLNRLTQKREWHSLLNPSDLFQAFRFASAVGALTATRFGAIPAMPSLADVEAFLTSADH